MALSSIKIRINNNQYTGIIEIGSELISQSISSNITYLLLYKKIHGTETSDYVRILEKSLTSISDLNFTFYDMITRSGTTYDYYVELTNGIDTSRIIYEFGAYENNFCWFDGLFIGDSRHHYLAPLNCETSVSRNNQVNYTTTIGARTPYRISNANTNYTTGSSSAIFCPIDMNGNLIKTVTKEYISEVVDFLTDGETKLLKTSDGDMWFVSIDPQIQTSFDNYFIGSSQISFTWTEIDDIPYIIDREPGTAVLIEKTIIENGIYNASIDFADGYKKVTVAVPTLVGTVTNHCLVLSHSTSGSEPIFR